MVNEIKKVAVEKDITSTQLAIAWIIAKDKEELPFYSFLLEHEEPESGDFVWANKAIKAYKAQQKNASK